MPFSDMAKTLGVSGSLIQIRYNKLRRNGVILGTSLIMNPVKCGIRCVANIGVNALENEVSAVIKYLQAFSPKKSKVKIFTTFGKYNITAVIYSKDELQAYKIKQYLKAHPAVIDVGVCINISPFLYNYNALELKKYLRGINNE